MQLDLTLTAVGLGPGDPELITVKGLRAIQGADVVFVPRSRDGAASLALRIAEPWLDRGRQRVVELPLPMTRDSDELVPAWTAAADTIRAALETARRGVYLLLGDPLLYGTFSYIWRALADQDANIAIEIVPGVTSFAAAAAATRTVLGTTDEHLAIVPASRATTVEKLRRLLAECDTLIVLKVGRVLPQVLAALDELGLLDSTLYAERVGMPEERIVRDVRSLGGQPQPYLSLLIVRRSDGEAKRRRDEEASNWTLITEGGEQDMAFRYESLKVWPISLEYVDACFIIADSLPQRAQFSIGEQLRRSATSVVANIAEGSAKSSHRSERNFYDIARGSLAETVALLALCHRRRYLDDDRHQRLYNRANVISSMLQGLIRANEGDTIAEAGETYAAHDDTLADFFASSPHASSPPADEDTR
jgi:precorrin-2/cobalt-factor-2 C20-methyltransferase